jgi:3-deoxy-7-phosphoheptulonate synthase
MWLLLKPEASAGEIEWVLRARGWPYEVRKIGGREVIVLPVNGQAVQEVASWEGVERVIREGEGQPALVYAAKGEWSMGSWRRGEGLLWIAGPCSVESRSQLLSTARVLRDIGVTALRGGAFKARTSPYSFQGLGAEAIDLLLEAKAETGLPLCVEVLSETHLPLYESIDILQVGARNMDHYELLKAVGKMGKPVLLKRNPQATLTEFLFAAEYLLLYGAPVVLLCERGIRTYERRLRYTLDVGGIAVLRSEVGLPVIADPSHAAGEAAYVEALALAAIGAGAEGLIVEVHPEPSTAKSDAQQQLMPDQFARLFEKANRLWATLHDTATPVLSAKDVSSAPPRKARH